jgi:hypothetical protein
VNHFGPRVCQAGLIRRMSEAWITCAALMPLKYGLPLDTLSNLYSLFGKRAGSAGRYGTKVADPTSTADYGLRYLPVVILNDEIAVVALDACSDTVGYGQ